MPLPIDFRNFDLVHAVPYGLQITQGRCVLYRKIGNRTACLIILSEGQCNKMRKVYYKGFAIPEFDSNNQRNWFFHDGRLSTGFTDPIQGRPFFFPTLDWCGNGVCYIEVLLPPEFSEGTDEPSEFRFLYECKLVMDYDASGNELGLVYSANNALVCADIMRNYLKIPNFIKRNDWASWSAFKSYCAALINWDVGKGLKGEYFNNEDFTDLRTTRIDPQIYFTWIDGSPSLEVEPNNFSVRWTGKIIPEFTETYTFYAYFDDSCRVWVNNVLIIDDWATGAAREKSGTIPLTANTEYDIKIEFRQNVSVAVMQLFWSSTSRPKKVIPQARFKSSTITVPRFEANVVAATQQDAFAAFYAALFLASGCGWQEQNSKIEWYTGTDRPIVHTFMYRKEVEAPKTNVLNGFGASRILMRDRPNLARFHFRNKLDDLLKEGRVAIQRQELRESVDGNIIDKGEQELGVVTPSQAQRVGNYQMRIESDLSLFIDQPAWADSYHVQVGDLVGFAHEVTGWTAAAAPRFQVVTAEFQPSDKQPDTRYFELQEWLPNGQSVYSDSDSSPITVSNVSELPSPLATPPKITGCVLSQGISAQPDGTYSLAINGIAQFNTSSYGFRQEGIVYVKFEGESTFRKVSDQPIIPDIQTMQAVFTIPNVPAGTHEVKVVTRNASGLTLGEVASDAYSTTIAAPLPTDKIIVETMRVRSKDRGLGFYIGLFPSIANSAAQIWFGAELWKARDGVNYRKAAVFDTPAIAGVTDNTLNTNGVGLAAANTFNDGSAGSLHIHLLSQDTTLPNAPNLPSVQGGLNRILVGKESLGYQLSAQRSGQPTGYLALDNLYRGQDLTEHAMDSHATGESVLVMTDAVQFIACDESEIGVPVSYKVVTRGQSLSSVAAFTVTLTGESLKGALPLNASGVKDANGDWLLSFDGRNRPDEPATFAADIQTLAGASIGRELPLFIGLPQAAILTRLSAALNVAGEREVEKNSVFGAIDAGWAGSQRRVVAKSNQEIRATGSFIEAAMSEDATGSGSDDVILFGLWRQGDAISVSTIKYGWYLNPVSNQLIAIAPDSVGDPTTVFDNSAFKYADGAIRQSIRISGTEVRFYTDYSQGKQPLWISAAAPNEYPYVVGAIVGYRGLVGGILLGNNSNRVSTIYSKAQQIRDFGSLQTSLRVKEYQKMPYSTVLKGQILDITF